MLLNEINFTFPEDKEVDGIIVKQYLSVASKMEIIGNTINNSVDDNNFYNPVRLDIFYVLNMIKAYTNIEYEEEAVLEAYDKIIGSGLWDKINNLIPNSEKEFIKENTQKVINNIYEYRNSALGVIENISEHVDTSIADGEAMQKAIADPENLKLIKSIVDKI